MGRGPGGSRTPPFGGDIRPPTPTHAWVFASLLFSMNFGLLAGTFRRPEITAAKRRPSPSPGMVWGERRGCHCVFAGEERRGEEVGLRA